MESFPWNIFYGSSSWLSPTSVNISTASERVYHATSVHPYSNRVDITILTLSSPEANKSWTAILQDFDCSSAVNADYDTHAVHARMQHRYQGCFQKELSLLKNCFYLPNLAPWAGLPVSACCCNGHKAESRGMQKKLNCSAPHTGNRYEIALRRSECGASKKEKVLQVLWWGCNAGSKCLASIFERGDITNRPHRQGIFWSSLDVTI